MQGVVNYIIQPIANYIVVEYGVAVKENVMMHSNGFNDGDMLVMYCVVIEIMAAKYMEAEDI